MSTYTLRTLLVACCLALGLAVIAGVGGFAVAQAETPAETDPIFRPVELNAVAKNVAIDVAGNAWFTLPAVDKLASVTPDGFVTYYTGEAGVVPIGGTPYDLVTDGSIVWFTLLNTNQIGKLDTSLPITTTSPSNPTFYTIPTPDSKPTGIALGGGYIWFVEREGDKLGRLNPADGTIVEYYNWVVDNRNPVDMTDAELEDVAYAPNQGAVWITGPTFKNQVAAYVIDEDRFIPSPAGTGANPSQLFVDSSGNIWVTFTGFNKIGRSAINTMGIWDFYDLPEGAGGPVGLFVTEGNNQRRLWYTRPDINQVGYVLVRNTGTRLGVWETTSPVPGSAPWGIGVNSSGVVWVASSTANTSLIWNPPYFSPILYFPIISRH